MTNQPRPDTALFKAADIALDRMAAGRHSQSLLLLAENPADGAAALDRLSDLARDKGALVVTLDGSNADRILSTTAEAISDWLSQPANGAARRAIQPILNGFKRAHGLVEPASIALKDTEIGVADSGMASFDVPDLITATAKAAKSEGKAVLLSVRNMDKLPLETMGTLISTLHKASQTGLPVLLFGAGREALRPMPATARSYAERMFKFHILERSPHADQSPDPRAAGLSVPAASHPAGPDHPKP